MKNTLEKRKKKNISSFKNAIRKKVDAIYNTLKKQARTKRLRAYNINAYTIHTMISETIKRSVRDHFNGQNKVLLGEENYNYFSPVPRIPTTKIRKPASTYRGRYKKFESNN